MGSVGSTFLLGRRSGRLEGGKGEPIRKELLEGMKLMTAGIRKASSDRAEPVEPDCPEKFSVRLLYMDS